MADEEYCIGNENAPAFMYLPRRIFHSPFAQMTSFCDVMVHNIGPTNPDRRKQASNSITLTADAGGNHGE